MGRGSTNRMILLGNVGQEPDVRNTTQGGVITNLNIATDEGYKDKTTGNWVEKTEWHRVVTFNRLAEIARDYVVKGAKVYIEAKSQTRKWQDQQGNDRYTHEFVAEKLDIITSPRKEDAGNQNNGLQSNPDQYDQNQYNDNENNQNFDGDDGYPF
ncbi:hypothetical protein A3715_17060 [Oleiphilus sp. HI0009]|nr:hypothetical protein A3715_17060 [Oleiphilus sp. HI0009]